MKESHSKQGNLVVKKQQGKGARHNLITNDKNSLLAPHIF